MQGSRYLLWNVQIVGVCGVGWGGHAQAVGGSVRVVRWGGHAQGVILGEV